MFPKIPLRYGTLLIILATCGTVFSQGEGDKHIEDSLNILLTASTVECDIRIETFVGGKKYAAVGRYEEQALPRPARRQSSAFLRSMYRQEIYFPMSTHAASNAERNRMTLVCRPGTNGGNALLEQYTHIEGVKVFRTVDLTRLEQRIRSANKEAVFAQVSEVRNLGGLSGMMRQINRFYEFSAPVQVSLPDGEISALKLVGQLRRIYHDDLLARFGGLDSRERYPGTFPSNIEIWLGRHDNFPYRIRYLRRLSAESNQQTLLFHEEFFNVIINGAPIPDARFAPLTIPDDVFSVQDDTDRVIGELGLW